MSKRAIRKRRHRSDFNDYLEAQKDFNEITKDFKKFGYKNRTAYVNAIGKAMQKQAAKSMTNNTTVNDTQANEDTYVYPLTEEKEHIHGEGCDHD